MPTFEPRSSLRCTYSIIWEHVVLANTLYTAKFPVSCLHANGRARLVQPLCCDELLDDNQPFFRQR